MAAGLTPDCEDLNDREVARFAGARGRQATQTQSVKNEGRLGITLNEGTARGDIAGPPPGWRGGWSLSPSWVTADDAKVLTDTSRQLH